MDVARKCHVEMRKKTERVITFMKMDDYGERTGRLTAAVASVEGKVGRPVKKWESRTGTFAGYSPD